MLLIKKIDEVYLQVQCESSVEAELSDFFKFEVPGAKFMPAFRAGAWDGKIYLYNRINKTIYVGLLAHIRAFARDRQYDIQYVNDVENTQSFEFSKIKQFATMLNLASRGQKITPYDYQLDAVMHALNNKRCVLLSPVGSGKSLMIYLLIRWFLLEKKKVIIIVPSTSLVEQLYADFKDYSVFNKWDVDNNAQKIYSGFPKEISSKITITTWQSVYKNNKEWFSQFDVVIGDEAHSFAGKSLTSLMAKMPNVEYRIGTTGSLTDDKKVNKLVIEGLFGAIKKVASIKDLQRQNVLSALQIKSIVLKYPQEHCKMFCKANYKDEIDFLISNRDRNQFIANLAANCSGNTLVMFSFVKKHGVILHQLIKDKVGDTRPVHFIYGGTEVDAREEIRHILAIESNAIAICSFGTTAQGVNMPAVKNIIFASPSKSLTRVTQTLGRGLRLYANKYKCTLFDITDDLSYNSKSNHTLRHGAERYKLYANEQFPVKLIEVPL